LRSKRRASPEYLPRAAGSIALPLASGLRNWPPTGPLGPIVEKRRLASYDEVLFIITTSPLDIPPTAPARPLPIILPSGDSWYFPRLWPTGATQRPNLPKPCAATGCTATITLKLRRTGNCLARERGLGNEDAKDRSVITNLTLNGTREPLRDTRPHRWARYMSQPNDARPVHPQSAVGMQPD